MEGMVANPMCRGTGVENGGKGSNCPFFFKILLFPLNLSKSKSPILAFQLAGEVPIWTL